MFSERSVSVGRTPLSLYRFAPVLFASLTLAGVLSAAESQRPMLGGRPDFQIRELPAGRLRTQIEFLPEAARTRATEWLRRVRFPAEDVASLQVDKAGGILYACGFEGAAAAPRTVAASTTPDAAPPTGSQPAVLAATVPVSPFPSTLKFHSRPGATNVIFLDFDGHTVSGTAWNTSEGRDPIQAVPFSTDADYATFSDAEQTAICRVWQRVAEDYAPFDVDVTTEAPATFTARTAHALITRNTDAGGAANPYSTSGGVAYVDVFGFYDYADYRPAWIYFNNLADAEQNIAEAASHETGHNLGLSHDGKTGGTEYYAGHGSGLMSWAPIMGSSYGKNVTQWSKGEYYLANNTEDDLAIIAEKLQVRADDCGDTTAAAAFLCIKSGTNVASTTPATDPDNTDPRNKGVIERSGDVDVWGFSTGAGAVRLDVKPWISPANTRGNSLDLRLRLLDASGTAVASSDPTDETAASINATVSAGVYFLEVRNAVSGNPLVSPPTGYTAYGSIGQYFIAGRVQAPSGAQTPPTAVMQAAHITLPCQTAHMLAVTYTDDLAVDAVTLDSGDIRVTGPNGYDRAGAFVGATPAGSGTPRTATYALAPPGAVWQHADNGVYTVWLQSGQVADVQETTAAAQTLGTFECRVPATFYAADMTTDPGWYFDSGWAYGIPDGGGTRDPVSGNDGVAVVGFNLNGDYTRSLALRRTSTPAFDCSQAATVKLMFQRWLGVCAGDTASIEVAVDDGPWSTVWTAVGAVMDGAWVAAQYDLTAAAAGHASVRLRWTIGSNSDKLVACGWNLDNVFVVGELATPPPVKTWTLTAGVNNAAWGAVLPGGGVFTNGASVAIRAVAANYYRFTGWSGGLSGTNNPCILSVTTNLDVCAVFTEVVTTNHPTPCWWLAQYGYTNGFESAVDAVGRNGHALWESYVAGLDPTNPDSALRIVLADTEGGAHRRVLKWSTISGRVYSVYSTPALTQPFTPVPGGLDLPWTQGSYTTVLDNAVSFWQIRARQP